MSFQRLCSQIIRKLVFVRTRRYYGASIEERPSEASERAVEGHFKEVFKSVTADNGSEFSRLSEFEEYGVSVYFAHPYSSWERPQNERHNRIFRRYVPKGVSIENCSTEQILHFADEMNALPRKILEYCTPEELFDAFLDHVYSVDKVQVA